MSKEAEYRANAASAIESATRASNTRDKARLLAMAEKWLDLAQRAHGLAARFKSSQSQHPLLRSKLDEIHPDAE